MEAQVISILFLSFIQSITFTIASRARNRNNWTYLGLANIASNTIWVLTMRHMVVGNMSTDLLVCYVVGATIGSMVGAMISQRIEARIRRRERGSQIE